MNTTRLATRGPLASQVPSTIADHKPFTTSGGLKATVHTAGSVWRHNAGRLAGADLDAWSSQYQTITYIVWSYATPIAWVTETGAVHVVAQRFSVTTSAHQSKLYLLRDQKI